MPSGTSQRRKKVKAPTREDRDSRKRELLDEIAFLTDEQDAVKKEINKRKDELLLLMSQDGDRALEKENVAGASFTQRRSFQINDTKKLSQMFTREQLAEHVKITAAFYDAAQREGYRIETAVTVGVSESLTVSRAKTKDAKKIRQTHIEEARKATEAKVAEFRKQLKQF
jgi:L-serine deaminase